jgi:SAM-dependent methyltransferase
MSDEVRSNSSPTPPDTGGLTIDQVDGPTSLDIEFPTPDIDLADSGPIAGPNGVETETAAEAGVLPNKDVPKPPASDGTPPYSSERPPPPSQRVATQHRVEWVATPVPPSPGGTNTLPAPSWAATLPAPAPVLDWPTPTESTPFAAFTPGVSLEPGLDVGALGGVTEPAPPPRMQSEPVPLVRPPGSGPLTKQTVRPGLVEPKRIIEVLGSNVPVLDSALEEDAIEDLDDSEARELSETPLPDAPPISVEPELDVSVVVEDFPVSVEVPIDGAERDEDEAGGEAAAGAGVDDGGSGAFDSSSEASDPANRRVKAPPNKRRRPPPPSSRSQELRKPEPPSPPGARKWWEEMFSEEFLRAIPILSPKQLDREVDFIDDALAVARGGRILDLACGAGQHAVELAMRGYDLVGFDLSQSQLDWAGGLAQERNQRLQFTYGDMRDLTYNESFDAVYSWNTSFGFFEEDKNVDVAQRVFRALRPGGRFLLDVINRDFVVAQQPGQTWFEGDGCVCIDDVSIDFITSRMKVKRTLMLTNGKNRECNYSLRIYGLHELGKILHDVGFKVLNVSGRPEMPGVFFGATSPRIIILAVKP